MKCAKKTARPELFSDEDRRIYLDAWSQPGALTGGLNWYRAVPDRETNMAAAAGAGSFNVNVPTLVIWGEQDTALLTGNLEGLENFVPQLAIKRIPDGTHWVVHEEPALVNRYIHEFIDQ